MNPVTLGSACALCEGSVDAGAAAHAVHGKVVCGACRELVMAAGPRRVLAYAGGARRRRRWLVAGIGLCAALVLALATGLVVRQVAVQRARAEEMRALLAQRQAMLAAQQAVAARMRAQRPATGPVE